MRSDGLQVSAGCWLLVPLQPLHHRPVALLQGRHVLQPGHGGGGAGGLVGALQAEEPRGGCAVERSGSSTLRPGLRHARGFPPWDVSQLQIVILNFQENMNEQQDLLSQ